MSEVDDGGSGSPSQKAVFKALGRLCRYGVEVWAVRERAGVLFDLACVRERAEKEFKGKDDELSLALIATLRDRVETIKDTQHGKILWIVLGLDDKYLKFNATERRAIAGKEFRDGKRPVTQGTIRQHHEPEALRRLASILLASELKSQPA